MNLRPANLNGCRVTGLGTTRAAAAASVVAWARGGGRRAAGGAPLSRLPPRGPGRGGAGRGGWGLRRGGGTCETVRGWARLGFVTLSPRPGLPARRGKISLQR